MAAQGFAQVFHDSLPGRKGRGAGGPSKPASPQAFEVEIGLEFNY